MNDSNKLIFSEGFKMTNLKFKKWDKVRVTKDFFPFMTGDELRIAEISKKRAMPFFCAKIHGESWGQWLCADEIEKIQ